MNKSKKLILTIGSGRSGMRWTTSICEQHKNVTTFPEPHPVEDAFFRYSQWNQLPIDHTGYFQLMRNTIESGWKKTPIVMYSTPNISRGINLVARELKPDFIIFCVRFPEKIVNSLYCKNWYENENYRTDPSLVNGVQPGLPSQKHFGRPVPNSDEYEMWRQLSRIGKISWYVDNYIYHTYQSLMSDGIKDIKKIFLKLEDTDQNYLFYKKFSTYLNFKGILSEEEFLNLKDNQSNLLNKKRLRSEWDAKEEEEFVQLTSRCHEIYNKITTFNPE